MIASTGKVNYFKLVLCAILIHMSCAIFYLLCNALHSFHFNPLRIFRFTYCLFSTWYFYFIFIFLQAPKENWLSYHFLIKKKFSHIVSYIHCELRTDFYIFFIPLCFLASFYSFQYFFSGALSALFIILFLRPWHWRRWNYTELVTFLRSPSCSFFPSLSL